VRRFFDWLLWSEGSTRTVGLIRMGVVALLWDRFAADLLFYRADDAVELAISATFFVATSLLFVGLWTTFSAALNAATMLTIFVFLGHVRDVEPYRHHHVFLLVSSSVLLALTPCGRSFSLDRARALRRALGRGGAAPPERGPLHGQRLLAMQISAVYLWATWDKLTPGFLSGERLQHILIDRYFTSDPVTLPGFAALCAVGAVGTVVIESALAVGLWVRRVQVPLMVLGAIFHGMLFVVLPVGPFSLNMILLYLAFLDPAVVHRAVDRMVGAPRLAG
jgi:hypothetical protein